MRSLEIPLAARGPDAAPLTLLLQRASAAGGAALVLACVRTPTCAPGGAGLAAVAARAGLTPAEREVLDALAQGYSNPEIAAYLGVSRGTVRTHLGHIYAKLGVHSRTQALVALAREAL